MSNKPDKSENLRILLDFVCDEYKLKSETIKTVDTKCNIVFGGLITISSSSVIITSLIDKYRNVNIWLLYMLIISVILTVLTLLFSMKGRKIREFPLNDMMNEGMYKDELFLEWIAYHKVNCINEMNKLINRKYSTYNFAILLLIVDVVILCLLLI